MNLSVKQISYSISGKDLLKDISFQLNKGEVLAMLGHNGAGKTTLFEILTDIIRPDSGKIFYNQNRPFSALKGRIGVLWDNISLFPLLKVKEVINYVSAMYKLDKVPLDSFNFLDLKPIENSLMQKLSKGEKRKVEIFVSTVHNPDLLILDEPTYSLDPIIKNVVWENIILQKDRTVLFSTHQWEEACKYATKIIFLYKGKILNEPVTSEEVINSSGFSKKIITHNTIELKGINAFFYEKNSNFCFLIEKEDDSELEKIKQQTMNYSISPIDLEDIYHYLINKML
jgi:ABC-2 type transport system ATP-binding protein